MRLGRTVIFSWLAMTLPAGAVMAQAPAAPKPGAAVSAPHARSKASLDELLGQGSDALAAGQYKAAHEAFLDAISLEPRNLKAAHGLAICLVASGEIAKAAKMFDKALTLTTSPDRALVINAAAANMAVRAHMRAAKLTKDYLAAHPREADEAMLDALGTALSAATPTERKNRFFMDAASFYMIANQRLEAARPGYKRFGAQWYTTREADEKSRLLAGSQKKLDALSDAVALAEDRFFMAEKEYNRQRNMIDQRIERPGNSYMLRAQAAYDAARTALDQAGQKYDELAASLERPKFPETILMVAMDATTTPPFSEPITVAKVDPQVTPAVKPKPTVDPSTPKPADHTRPARPTDVAANDHAKPPPLDLKPPVPRASHKVRITQYAAAFPITGDLVVTSAAGIKDSSSLQLQMSDGQSLPAELVRKDDKCGLALLRITGDKKLHPLALADTFAGGAVTCASFPSVDLFSPAVQSIRGSAAAPRDGWTVSLGMHPRLAGAPILAGGRVVGVCIAPRDAERGKLPAVTLEQLKTFLGNDLTPPRAAGDPATSLLQLIATRESE